MGPRLSTAALSIPGTVTRVGTAARGLLTLAAGPSSAPAAAESALLVGRVATLGRVFDRLRWALSSSGLVPVSGSTGAIFVRRLSLPESVLDTTVLRRLVSAASPAAVAGVTLPAVLTNGSAAASEASGASVAVSIGGSPMLARDAAEARFDVAPCEVPDARFAVADLFVEARRMVLGMVVSAEVSRVGRDSPSASSPVFFFVIFFSLTGSVDCRLVDDGGAVDVGCGSASGPAEACTLASPIGASTGMLVRTVFVVVFFRRVGVPSPGRALAGLGLLGAREGELDASASGLDPSLPVSGMLADGAVFFFFPLSSCAMGRTSPLPESFACTMSMNGAGDDQVNTDLGDQEANPRGVRGERQTDRQSERERERDV